MKSYVKVALLGLLAISLFSSCDKPKETSEEGGGSTKKNYTETAFGMDLEMVYVEGGTFEMGATAEQGEGADDDEKPVRTIKLDSYHIGKYEVTQAQWKAVMGTTLKEQLAISEEDNGIEGEGADYPMYYVSWDDAKAFCDSLSKQTGRKYILPTEAQWEYAARGGVHKTKTMYAGSNDFNEVAWCDLNSRHLGSDHPDYGTHPIGMKKANELGIYDMSGNVWEWCSDWYASPYDENDTDNPQGPTSGLERVVRGGSWVENVGGCLVSYRDRVYPDYRYYGLGFRVACISK